MHPVLSSGKTWCTSVRIALFAGEQQHDVLMQPYSLLAWHAAPFFQQPGQRWQPASISGEGTKQRAPGVKESNEG
jgi:hypothetical protein